MTRIFVPRWTNIHEKNTLELTDQNKKEKSVSLAQELRQLRRQEVRVTAAIVIERSRVSAVLEKRAKSSQMQ
jgi:hypothetical protein